jgi:hypothetical protein
MGAQTRRTPVSPEQWLLGWVSHPVRRLACVPRLCEFYGIVIYMYWIDHPPPHFHALYGGDEALVAVADGSILAGSLPRTAHRLVREWASIHRGELEENWRRARRPEALRQIDPLQ